jgi:hypothetical protein
MSLLTLFHNQGRGSPVGKRSPWGDDLLTNGGMEGTYDDESSGGGGTINVAPNWDNLNCETDGTDTLDESADAHGGSSSQQIAPDGTFERIITSPGDAFALVQGNWYLFTFWVKITSGGVQVLVRSGEGGAIHLNKTETSAANWTQFQYNFQAAETTADGRVIVGSSAIGTDILVDDFSLQPRIR